jgi:UDP-N-acetylglucosamine/UDP-N-acetylgalactosamine diphosphorylase
MDIAKLRSQLQAVSQEHLLDFWQELSEPQQAELYNELADLDLEEVLEYFSRTVAEMHTAGAKLDDKMQPLTESQCGSTAQSTDPELAHYESLSMTEISQGKVGILLLAGGQGTRLGTSYPKGMYDVGLPSNKTLFQLQAERIISLERLAEKRTGVKGSITWYIMTSASTIQPTKEYFASNNYFGLSADNVVVFQQGTLPCFTFDCRLLMYRPRCRTW